MIKYNNIIKSPIITEKASFLREKFNKYSLYVFVNVNKRQIKLAIESLFDVKISSINVVRIKPKYRRFRGVIGCEKQKKKVYFSLMDGVCENTDIECNVSREMIAKSSFKK